MTAHEKLIGMGWEMVANYEGNKQYRKDIYFIQFIKLGFREWYMPSIDYVGIDVEFLKILIQYLEELEEK